MSVCGVVPAAGRGTRLGVSTPKILVELRAGLTVWDVLYGVLEPHTAHLHVVLSPTGARVFTADGHHQPGGRAPVTVGVQQVPTGMGDAVFECADVWSRFDDLLVVWGDQANLSAATVAAALAQHGSARGRRVTIPVARQSEPYVEYVFHDGHLGEVRQSREGELCTPGGFSDVGCFVLSTAGLAAEWQRYTRSGVPVTATGETNLLPFLPALSRAGWSVDPLQISDADEARGVNTAADLEFARRRLEPTQ